MALVNPHLPVFLIILPPSSLSPGIGRRAIVDAIGAISGAFIGGERTVGEGDYAAGLRAT